MLALRTLGAVGRVAARTTQWLAVAGIAVGRVTTRRVLKLRHHSGGGETGMLRLLDLHAASCAGDTLVAIGLAGTVFFAVPAGEARGRVGLYLLVTMLPFALLAPVIGPVLDRFRHGRRYALAATMLGRAFLAYVIGEHMGGLTLYPAAFGVLALSRAYGVARSAAVPRVLPAGLGLSEAGARASLFGTLAGAAVCPIGLAVAAIGPAWPLRLSIFIFGYGMITALRLPPRADAEAPEVVPRLLQRPGHKSAKVLSGRLVVASLVGSATLRGLYGYLTLVLAFAVRAGTLPAATVLGHTIAQGPALAVVAAALGLGSLLATAIGTRLRIRRPTRLQAAGLVVTAVAAVGALVRPGLATAAALCFVVAIASGLAKLAVDATIQERVGEQIRASAFAHSETLLMTAWVAGGAIGLIPFHDPWGLVVAAVLALAGAARGVVVAARLHSERLTGVPDGACAPNPADRAGGGRRPPPAAEPTTRKAPSSEPTTRKLPAARPPGRRRPPTEPTTLGLSTADLTASAPPPAEPITDRLSGPRPASSEGAPGPDTPDEVPINSPGFHLYRPSSRDDTDGGGP